MRILSSQRMIDTMLFVVNHNLDEKVGVNRLSWLTKALLTLTSVDEKGTLPSVDNKGEHLWTIEHILY